MLEYNLEPSIISKKKLLNFINKAESKNVKDFPIHLKFNTGMNRYGLEKDQVKEVYDIVSKTNSVKIETIFSHLACSSEFEEIEFTNA
jgi:alanine racemase